ncbi:MAG: beta-lactamase family protein [Psychroflexus sp.]|nr:beta-lactamase family protein [Psychroflexus sp.]MDN6309485.1 beta-lactamase family protein [Psychroflexus sp.]
MKVIRQILKWIIGLLLLSLVLLYIFDATYILKGIRVVYFTGHKTAFIDDFPYFDNRTIENKTVQAWEEKETAIKPTSRLQDTYKEYGTIAYLIIKDGKILYENYAEDYSKDSKTNSFSMAKSITSVLLFKAIQDGFIKSLDQPITDFHPDFKGEFANQTTVGDLASMASGLNWEEDYYSPFSMTAKAYYDANISELIESLSIDEKPGESFEYLSGNTELLGMIITKAVGTSLSEYLSKSIWKPLGMRGTAYWQLDDVNSGMEKTYCCLASNARDFAKVGKLLLQDGKWDGQQIIDTDLVKKAINPRFEDSPHYGYGFWLSDYKDKHIFSMRGILGQYVISIPEDDLIIVRLGHKRDEEKVDAYPKDFYIYIDEAYQMLKT